MKQEPVDCYIQFLYIVLCPFLHHILRSVMVLDKIFEWMDSSRSRQSRP